MSLNRLIIIFGIILVIFAGVVFFQFNAKPNKKSIVKNSTSSSNTVTINNHAFKIAIAKTSEEQQKGLSGRDSLPQDEGMLFLFPKLDYYNFWMKNTKIPLDIIFIKDDKIVSIAQDAQPPKSDNPPIYKPEGLVNKVLEINGGLSEKYKIKKGDNVEIKF